MEPEGSLPHSQASATCPYPVPAQSSPHILRDISPRNTPPPRRSEWGSYSVITHNKTPVHSTWGLLRECAACSTPRLNLSSELRPSWNKIQDTFLIGSEQDTTVPLALEIPAV